MPPELTLEIEFVRVPHGDVIPRRPPGSPIAINANVIDEIVNAYASKLGIPSEMLNETDHKPRD